MMCSKCARLSLSVYCSNSKYIYIYIYEYRKQKERKQCESRKKSKNDNTNDIKWIKKQPRERKRKKRDDRGKSCSKILEHKRKYLVLYDYCLNYFINKSDPSKNYTRKAIVPWLLLCTTLNFP
jgi:hypothetical protein